jgi:hypothetical protein
LAARAANGAAGRQRRAGPHHLRRALRQSVHLLFPRPRLYAVQRRPAGVYPAPRRGFTVLVDGTFICSKFHETKVRIKLLWETCFGKSPVEVGGVMTFGGVAMRMPRPGMLQLSCPTPCHPASDATHHYRHTLSPTFESLSAPTTHSWGRSSSRLPGPSLARGGWLCINVRFEGYPDFVFLGSCEVNNLTPIVWRGILRWAH